MGAITDYFGEVKTINLKEHPEILSQITDLSQIVNNPIHYGGEDNPYEAIKVIEAWNLDFALGNVVKYINRAGKKGSKMEDLKKAQWYMNRAIEQAEKF